MEEMEFPEPNEAFISNSDASTYDAIQDEGIEVGVDVLMTEKQANFEFIIKNEIGTCEEKAKNLENFDFIVKDKTAVYDEETMCADDMISEDLSWEDESETTLTEVVVELKKPSEGSELPEEGEFPEIDIASPEIEIEEAEADWLNFIKEKESSMESEIPSNSRLSAGAASMSEILVTDECGQGVYSTPAKIKVKKHVEKDTEQKGKLKATTGKDPEEIVDHILRINNTDPFEFMFCIYVHYSYGAPMHEIIDFAAVLFDIENGTVMDDFHMYVKPELFPILTNYCKKSAGICQEAVDHGVTLERCLLEFEDWVHRCIEHSDVPMKFPTVKCEVLQTILDAELDNIGNTGFCCWSVCETIKIIHECGRQQIPHPFYMGPWLDMKQIFDQFYHQEGERVPRVGCRASLGLKLIGMEVDEQQRTATDAALNLAKLVCRMREDEDNIFQLRKTYWIPSDP